MPDFNHTLEVQKLEPDSLLELFELDISPVYDAGDFSVPVKYFFHGYNIRPEDSNAATQEDKDNGIILWQGNRYYPYPFESEGFEINAEGPLPRPTVRMANITPVIRDLTHLTNGLVGAYIYRHRVFYKFLDNMPDHYLYSCGFPRDLFVISRKKGENKFLIEFELVTPLEVGNIDLPGRTIITNTCVWRYRGEGCGYAGNCMINFNGHKYGEMGVDLPKAKAWEPNKVYAVNDTTYSIFDDRYVYYICVSGHTSNYTNKFSRTYWDVDECSKLLVQGCKARFKNDLLPYGGFPNAEVATA